MCSITMNVPRVLRCKDAAAVINETHDFVKANSFIKLFIKTKTTTGS
jgi:hypothetical protein